MFPLPPSIQILNWPKSSLRLWKNSNELFGQPNIFISKMPSWCQYSQSSSGLPPSSSVARVNVSILSLHLDPLHPPIWPECSMLSLTTLLNHLFCTLCPVPTSLKAHEWDSMGGKDAHNDVLGRGMKKLEQTSETAVTEQCHGEVHDVFPNGFSKYQVLWCKDQELISATQGRLCRGAGARGSMKITKECGK